MFFRQRGVGSATHTAGLAFNDSVDIAPLKQECGHRGLRLVDALEVYRMYLLIALVFLVK